MSVFEMIADGTAEATGERPQAPYATSPFAAAALFRPEATTDGLSEGAAGLPAGSSISTPFAEALASYDEAQLEAETFEALLAEFEDEDFVPALQALADEAAARHLTGASSWTESEQGMARSAAEAQQWMEAVADRSDRLLAELESHFGQRPVESVAPGEIESVAGAPTEQSLGGPPDTLQMFEGGLLGKVTKVVRGVGKVLGKVALGPLFGVLRKLVRPLLQRVLQRAIGKLPAEHRPAAEKLRAKFGGKPAAAAGTTTPTTPAEPAAAAEPAVAPSAPDAAAPAEPSTQELADEFDSRLAEALLSPEGAAGELLARYEGEMPQPAETGPYAALDAGRQRLAQQLIATDPGRPPTAELEEFIPVVMAAMKLIKMGVRVIGRPPGRRVHRQAARQPDQGHGRRAAGPGPVPAHRRRRAAVARPGGRAPGRPDARRRGLGRCHRGHHPRGAVAAGRVAGQRAASRGRRPGSVHRRRGPALPRRGAAPGADRVHRVTRSRGQRARDLDHVSPCGPAALPVQEVHGQPVRITRALARSVILTDGESLEDRLLDAGARRWPVAGEVHRYELLPGAELGHLAAYEIPEEMPSYAEAARQFELVSPTHPLAHPAGPQRTTVVRVVVPGLALRPSSPFSLRLDLAGPKPSCGCTCTSASGPRTSWPST